MKITQSSITLEYVVKSLVYRTWTMFSKYSLEETPNYRYENYYNGDFNEIITFINAWELEFKNMGMVDNIQIDQLIATSESRIGIFIYLSTRSTPFCIEVDLLEKRFDTCCIYRNIRVKLFHSYFENIIY